MNDKERAMWIDNDEYLYDMKRHSGYSMKAFIKLNRQKIDEIINHRNGRIDRIIDLAKND